MVNTNPYKTQGYLGYGAGGYPNKAQGADVINEIYPWRYFSINELKNFRLPFWNPHNFSGNPQLANFQTAVFYPFNFLYFLLPFNLSWTLLIMLQPFLAGVFMYLFLKKGIGLKNLPSVIGGVSFGFSSYMSVWMEYGNIGSTLLWLPLILLFTKYYFQKTNVVNFLGITLSLFSAFLAGYIQGVFYIYVITFLYYIFLCLSKKGSFKEHKKNLLFLCSLFIPTLLSSFQIIPTLDLFSQSTRGAYTLDQIEKNLSPLVNLITIFFPDFFGNPATRNYWLPGTYIERVMYSGSAILFFAIYSIFSKINILEKKFFLIISVISLVIATSFPFVKYFYLIPIPVISTTVASREFNIFIFAVIILGAIGINHFLENKNSNKLFPPLYLIGLVIFIGFIILGVMQMGQVENLKISLRNMVLPGFLLILTIVAFYLKKLNNKLTLIILVTVVIVDLFYFFYKITPFSPQELVYPQTAIMSYAKQNLGINRFWGYGLAYIPANFQSVDGTFSPEGNDPLHISRYTELLAASKDGKLPQILPRPDANIAGGFGPDDLKTNLYRKKVLDILSVKYILHQQDLVDAWYTEDLTTFPSDQFKMIHKIYPWQIYENLNSLPRFFLNPKFILAKDKPEALSLFYSKDINLKETLILESEPNLSIDKNSSGTAQLVSYKPDRVIINTSSSGNNLLFISDTYYPEWRVKIDGINSQLLIADYAFRAVAVPGGDHTIEFFYDPQGFKLGVALSVIGVFIIFVVVFYIKKNEKKL